MLWVVLPALNEAENLRVLVPRIIAAVRTLSMPGHVLVVDDGSTDDTSEVVGELMARHSGVALESMGRNFGKAKALQRGFDLAIAGGATHLAMMDADGQDDPNELGRLLDRLAAGADLVTGARYERNDRFIKRKTSRIYNRVTAVLSGAPGRDFNSGFKVMKAGVARDVAPMLYGELHRYLTVIAHWLGYRVAEEPVQHHQRMYGHSKYGLARFWRGFADLLTVRFLMSYENRPSHLFGGLGIISLLVGSGAIAYLVAVKLSGEPIGDRPLLIAAVLMVMIGAQLLLFGLLAELTVHARNQGTRR